MKYLTCLSVAAFGLLQAQNADLVILNGKVYTADGSGKFQEAVAIHGNRILRVGKTQEISALRGPHTQVIDAHGAAVVSGFNDIQVHLLSGGLALDNVMLQGARTLEEVARRQAALPRPS